MNTSSLENFILLILPALLVGLLAYYFFNTFFKNEDKKRFHEQIFKNKKESLPIRLQAYERMALFLERIVPHRLLVRISPQSSNSEDYLQLLISHIEQEFEHNLAQQIYLSDAAWNLIKTAKNTTINQIRTALNDQSVQNQDLREKILSELSKTEPPSHVALRFLKEEVKTVLG